MQTIGKYQVLEVLGQGGMGVVYRARDNAIGRQVALKVMRPEVMNSGDLRERFLREARAAGNLQHPNIVVVYDLGEDNGSPYIAMEFLSGQPLDQAIDAGSLNPTEKLQLFAQICDGLQFAHEAGVIHRDIKPANVMIVRNTAKLLDFGIARMQGSQITRSTAIIGTVSYMSPEQIRGKGVDARSDIFSAGVMLYEMLSARRPFDQDSDFDTMQAIVGQEPPELSVEGVISPDTLASIVRRALEKDPANRYQTAAEFADAVRGYLRAQERGGTAPTVVRSQPETAGAAVSRAATPRPVLEPATMVPPTVQRSSQGAIPEVLSREPQPPSAAEIKKKPRRLVLWALVAAAVLCVFLFVPASRFAPFWLTPTPHPEHVLGSVQLRLVAPANAAGADKFPLKGTDQSYDLERAVIVDQSDIARATAEFDTSTRPQVFLTLTANGAEKMRKASAQNIGRQMGIVVDGELVEVATIQAELGDSIAISGMQTPTEAEDLAKRINGEKPPSATVMTHASVEWPKSLGVYVAERSEDVPPFPAEVSGYVAEKAGLDYRGGDAPTVNGVRMFESAKWGKVADFPVGEKDCAQGIWMMRWHTVDATSRVHAGIEQGNTIDLDNNPASTKPAAFGYMSSTSCTQPWFEYVSGTIPQGSDNGMVEVQYELKFWRKAP